MELMENVPERQEKRCPHCYGPLMISRFGPAGRPVYYCENCAAPVLNPVRDSPPSVAHVGKPPVPISDSGHCPRCGSGAARPLRMTLYGQEVRCRACAKVYIVAADYSVQNGLPIMYQGVES